MFLHLSPQDSLISYHENTCWDFTTDIGQQVNLSGKWAVALTEIVFDGGKKTDLCVFSDICSSSYVSGKFLPILRIVNKSIIIQQPYFIPVTRSTLSQIRIYIRTGDGQIPSFAPKHLRCTLQLRSL